MVMPFDLLIGGANARDMLHGAFVIEAVGEGQVLGVIGDGDVLVAALFRRFGHFVDGALAVGLDGVHVDFAAKVSGRNQLWQPVLSGGFDLAATLAQLGRNGVKLELAVDLIFRRAAHTFVVVQPKQPVLVQRVAHLERALAQRDVVVLGAGEVLHGGAIGFRRQHAHVHLHAAAQLEADLVIALRQHFLNTGEAQDLLDQGSAHDRRPRSRGR